MGFHPARLLAGGQKHRLLDEFSTGAADPRPYSQKKGDGGETIENENLRLDNGGV